MLIGSYTPWLVIVSFLVAVLASFTALDMASRVTTAATRRTTWLWLIGGGCAMGLGISNEIRARWLVFEAGAMAGELVAQGTGLAFAQMSDPLRGGSSGVIGQWFYLLFGLLFFTANGHLALISLLMDSYKALPIGTSLPDPQAFLSIAPTFLLQVFRGALTLALPLTVAMLAINLAFGVLARAAPALNPIQLGLPVALLLGLFLLTVLAGEMGPPVQRLFDAAFDAADSVSR